MLKKIFSVGKNAYTQFETVVAQKANAPGIHCYVAGSIPAVTPRYCRKTIEKCSLEHKKRKKEKKNLKQTDRFRTIHLD